MTGKTIEAGGFAVGTYKDTPFVFLSSSKISVMLPSADVARAYRTVADNQHLVVIGTLTARPDTDDNAAALLRALHAAAKGTL